MHTENHPKHYCGLFGICRTPLAARYTYEGLYAQQHRGQESAGISTRLADHKDEGLVLQVFTCDVLKKLTGNSAIGHIRYSTAGGAGVKNAQPLVATTKYGRIAIAHNGNLTNAHLLRPELEARGVILQTDIDSELFLQLIALSDKPTVEEAIKEAVLAVQGAFSLVILTPDKLIGLRDGNGFRPLSLGKLGDAFVFASETCAFSQIKASFVRDIGPGEMVVITDIGEPISYKLFAEEKARAFCIFEYVYFARPDSALQGRNVYKVRVAMGRELAREYPIQADVVVPIPDSGNTVALGISLETGIPYTMAYVRNHYAVVRTFLEPNHADRVEKARMKLTLNAELVRDKRVILADDSVVRGVTTEFRVKELLAAGATEVHVLIGCPPQLHPCVYGIDFPRASELLAVRHPSIEEIRAYLGATSVRYLSLAGMVAATGLPKSDFCLACYTGVYPVPYETEGYERSQRVS